MRFRAFLFLILCSMTPTITSGECAMSSGKVEKLKALLQKNNGLMDIRNLPPISRDDKDAWFNKGSNTILSYPDHDCRIVTRSPNSMSHPVSQIVFLNTKNGHVYVMERGGIGDNVNWYGPLVIE